MHTRQASVRGVRLFYATSLSMAASQEKEAASCAGSKGKAADDVDAGSTRKAADDVDQHKETMQFCECPCANPERMIHLGGPDPFFDYIQCQCRLCGPHVNGERQCTTLVISCLPMCGQCRGEHHRRPFLVQAAESIAP